MSDTLSRRESIILRSMRYGDAYAAVAILTMFGDDAPAPATVRRDMQALVQRGYVEQMGERRGTTYRKTLRGALESPYEPVAYYAQRESVRRALVQYQYGYLNRVEDQVFCLDTVATLDTATQRYHERRAAASPGVQKRELERFVIEFSWKSSAIEGNTYTLLDTERLLTEGVEAPGHSKEEARMILNHKQALSFAAHLGSEVTCTRRLVEDLHALLTEGLGVAHGVRRGEVGIVGTNYRPPSVQTRIEEELNTLCERVQSMADPYSRALLALVGVSYLQPFEDGNKRTARLLANALLLQHDRAPISYRDTEVKTYRESMLVFYEQLSLVPMRNIFVSQYQYACEHYLMPAEG